MVTADRHRLEGNGRPADTATWLRKYGYRGAGVGLDGTAAGMLFNRPGEPVQLAVVGDTLRWDGRKKCVVVEYPPGSSVAQATPGPPAE